MAHRETAFSYLRETLIKQGFQRGGKITEIYQSRPRGGKEQLLPRSYFTSFGLDPKQDYTALSGVHAGTLPFFLRKPNEHGLLIALDNTTKEPLFAIRITLFQPHTTKSAFPVDPSSLHNTSILLLHNHPNLFGCSRRELQTYRHHLNPSLGDYNTAQAVDREVGYLQKKGIDITYLASYVMGKYTLYQTYPHPPALYVSTTEVYRDLGEAGGRAFITSLANLGLPLRGVSTSRWKAPHYIQPFTQSELILSGTDPTTRGTYVLVGNTLNDPGVFLRDADEDNVIQLSSKTTPEMEGHILRLSQFLVGKPYLGYHFQGDDYKVKAGVKREPYTQFAVIAVSPLGTYATAVRYFKRLMPEMRMHTQYVFTKEHRMWERFFGLVYITSSHVYTFTKDGSISEYQVEQK